MRPQVSVVMRSVGSPFLFSNIPQERVCPLKNRSGSKAGFPSAKADRGMVAAIMGDSAVNQSPAARIKREMAGMKVDSSGHLFLRRKSVLLATRRAFKFCRGLIQLETTIASVGRALLFVSYPLIPIHRSEGSRGA